MALTPSNSSVASLPLYSAHSHRETEHTKGGPSKSTEHTTMNRPQPIKMSSFGGIMISQEVTVDVQETGNPTTTMSPTNTNNNNNENNSSTTTSAPPELALVQTPPPTHQPYSLPSMQDVADAGNQMAPQFDRAIELREVVVSPLLGLGMSKVEVKKEDGEDGAATWVDALFSRCLH
jgi:hypothetical protein